MQITGGNDALVSVWIGVVALIVSYRHRKTAAL